MRQVLVFSRWDEDWARITFTVYTVRGEMPRLDTQYYVFVVNLVQFGLPKKSSSGPSDQMAARE
jgi:hypothetical protein